VSYAVHYERKRKTNLLLKCQNCYFSSMTFLLNVKPKTSCSSKLKALLKKRAERILIKFVTNSVPKKPVSMKVV